MAKLFIPISVALVGLAPACVVDSDATDVDGVHAAAFTEQPGIGKLRIQTGCKDIPFVERTAFIRRGSGSTFSVWLYGASVTYASRPRRRFLQPIYHLKWHSNEAADYEGNQRIHYTTTGAARSVTVYSADRSSLKWHVRPSQHVSIQYQNDGSWLLTHRTARAEGHGMAHPCIPARDEIIGAGISLHAHPYREER